MASGASPIPACCLRSNLWDGTPTGTVTTLPGTHNPAYVAYPPTTTTTSSRPRAAILLVHDALGWTFPNARLLADRYAAEAGAAVYVPDFFGGEVLPFEPILAGRYHEVDLQGFLARNARTVREPEILGYARVLRGMYDRVGAIGFCYGGWAVFRLGAGEFVGEEGKEENGDDGDGDAGGEGNLKGRRRGLVDCIAAGHPSLLTEKDIDEVAVPVQILAPEIDQVYTPELKAYTFSALQRKGVPFDYQHFPGVEHACLVRGDPNRKGEREAMARGKNAAVAWFRRWLHDD
ncbi:hypothetical protein VTK56DRAFT_5441 [Thermocarpiscus australiensis]